jgi:hypothetical protein
MNDLELIKAFAEIDGVEFFINNHGVLCHMPPRNVVCAMIHTPYNPITDLALNCAARDKYRVEIDYDLCEVNIYKPREFHPVIFEHSEDIQRAVIECIVKANK